MGERIGFLGIGKLGDRIAVKGPLRRHPGLRNRLPNTKFDWGPEGPPPDRIYLEKVLLPRLAQEGPFMLSVGVANYTQGSRRIVDNEQRGIQYITTDAGVDKNERGVPDFHLNVTDPQFPAQIREALQQDQTFAFDSIVLNGIIGWGTNTEAETERMLQNCHEYLRACLKSMN